MCLTHPIHDLPLELKLVIIDCVSLHFPSLKALFQSRLWHRDCGVYIQKQVFRNITLAINQTRDRKQAIPTALLFKRAIPNIPTEAVLASLEKTQRLRTYVRTMSVQEDIWSDGDTRNVSRLAAIITDMSRLEWVSLNHCIRPSHSVINALTSSPSLRVVVFKACSFSLQDIVNLLYSVPCLAVLHFEDMVSVNGLAEVHDESVICPLIDFGDANTRLQNGVSLENREQGANVSALHLWDFLATSGVLREVGTLDVTAFDLYPVTPDRLQTMVNLTRRLFAIHGTDFRGDDRQGLKDKEPIHPVLQLNNISSYQFNISIDIHRPHYDTAAYVLDEKLLLWNIQALNTSHQLETLVIEFSLDSLYRPTNSNEARLGRGRQSGVNHGARTAVLLLVFLASDRLEDVQKWMTAWILQRLPRTTTKFGLSEELGWHWNKGSGMLE
ncbi:hypothetical protein BDZ89DRAFT_1072951, partial [Hymenopellis radicata]